MLRYVLILMLLPILAACDHCWNKTDANLPISDSVGHAFAPAGNGSRYIFNSAITGLPIDSFLVEDRTEQTSTFNGNVGSCTRYHQERIEYTMRSLANGAELNFYLAPDIDGSLDLNEINFQPSGTYAGTSVTGELTYIEKRDTYTSSTLQPPNKPLDSLRLGDRIFHRVFTLPVAPGGDTTGNLFYLASGIGLVGMRLKDSASTQLLFLAKSDIRQP